MSRFGYLEGSGEDYPNAGVLWQATVRNTLRGRKALPYLRELEAALLALPEPRLIEGALARRDGACCALGAWARLRLDAGGSLHPLWGGEPEIRTFADLATLGEATADESLWAEEFGVVNGMLRPLAWEIAYQNDEGVRHSATDEERYAHVLRWVRAAIAENPHGREEVAPWTPTDTQAAPVARQDAAERDCSGGRRAVPDSLHFTVPLPPSENHLHYSGQMSRYATKEYREWLLVAAPLLDEQLAGREPDREWWWAVQLDLMLGSRGDGPNYAKALLDLLSGTRVNAEDRSGKLLKPGGLWDDDRRVRVVHVRVAAIRSREPSAEVWATAYPAPRDVRAEEEAEVRERQRAMREEQRARRTAEREAAKTARAEERRQQRAARRAAP